MMWYIFFYIAVLLAARMLMGIEIILNMPKKQKKLYKKEVSPLDRWFLISASNKMSDFYSKGEGRRIHHTSILRVYRVLNIVNHILLLIVVLLYVVSETRQITSQILDYGLTCSLLWIFTVFLVLAFIEGWVINRKYHRNRIRHSRKNLWS